MELKTPLLQVALDLTDLGRAAELAVLISHRYPRDRVIMEAGTPLVKAWGAIAVSMLKDACGTLVFADTKTVDAGVVEAELMYSAGADIVSVLSLADEGTIGGMLQYARKRDKLLAVDLINNPRPLETARSLIEAGADIIIYHVGIDVQKRLGLTAADLSRDIESLVELRNEMGSRTLIAVAGGLKPGSIGGLIDLGADIAIVGSAITKARDPLEAVETILHEMRVV